MQRREPDPAKERQESDNQVNRTPPLPLVGDAPLLCHLLRQLRSSRLRSPLRMCTHSQSPRAFPRPQHFCLPPMNLPSLQILTYGSPTGLGTDVPAVGHHRRTQHPWSECCPTSLLHCPSCPTALPLPPWVLRCECHLLPPWGFTGGRGHNGSRSCRSPAETLRQVPVVPLRPSRTTMWGRAAIPPVGDGPGGNQGRRRRSPPAHPWCHQRHGRFRPRGNGRKGGTALSAGHRQGVLGGIGAAPCPRKRGRGDISTRTLVPALLSRKTPLPLFPAQSLTSSTPSHRGATQTDGYCCQTPAAWPALLVNPGFNLKRPKNSWTSPARGSPCCSARIPLQPWHCFPARLGNGVWRH